MAALKIIVKTIGAIWLFVAWLPGAWVWALGGPAWVFWVAFAPWPVLLVTGFIAVLAGKIGTQQDMDDHPTQWYQP